MGDGVNIAARLEGIAKPGAICLSEDAYRQVKSRLDLTVSDLGATELKNIAEPVRVYSLKSASRPRQSRSSAAAPKQRRIFVPLVAGMVALIVIAGGAWYFLGAHRTAVRRIEHTSAGQGCASFHRGAALRQPLGRSKPGLFR